MKKLLFLLLLIPALSRAANPSFYDLTNVISSFGFGTNYPKIVASTNIQFNVTNYYTTNIVGGVTNVTTNAVMFISSTAVGGGSYYPTGIVANAFTNPLGGNLSLNSTNIPGLTNNNIWGGYGGQTFIGEINLQNQGSLAGADYGGSGVTPNNTHRFLFQVFPYASSGSSLNYALWSYVTPSSQQLFLDLGGYSGNTGGASDVYIENSTNSSGIDTRWWHFDQFGNLSPAQTNSWQSIGLAVDRVPTIYAQTDNSAVVITTNLTATTVTTTNLNTLAITNGNMIIWGNTNTLPAINTNYTYLATATNAPGFLFVSSNGVWVRK